MCRCVPWILVYKYEICLGAMGLQIVIIQKRSTSEPADWLALFAYFTSWKKVMHIIVWNILMVAHRLIYDITISSSVEAKRLALKISNRLKLGRRWNWPNRLLNSKPNYAPSHPMSHLRYHFWFLPMSLTHCPPVINADDPCNCRWRWWFQLCSHVLASKREEPLLPKQNAYCNMFFVYIWRSWI